MLTKGQLPRFSAYAPLHTQITAERMNALVDGIEANRIMPGVGTRLQKSAQGVAVNNSRNSQTLFTPPMPFAVSQTDFSDTTPKATISAYSRLYLSLGTSAATVTGLTTEFALASNTHVWLQCSVASLAVTASAITTGTAWPTLVVTSGSPAVQSQFNVPIGKVTASAPSAPGFEFALSTTTYHFEQCLFSHLLVENRFSNLVATIYAFPWSGA
jgi:hypothetical protein